MLTILQPNASGKDTHTHRGFCGPGHNVNSLHPAPSYLMKSRSSAPNCSLSPPSLGDVCGAMQGLSLPFCLPHCR